MSIANKNYDTDEKKKKKQEPDLVSPLSLTPEMEATNGVVSDHDDILGDLNKLERAGTPATKEVPKPEPVATPAVTGEESAAERAELARQEVAKQTTEVANSITQLVGPTDLRGYAYKLGGGITQDKLTSDNMRKIVKNEINPEALGGVAKQVVENQEGLLAGVQVDPNTTPLQRFDQGIDAIRAVNWKIRELTKDLEDKAKYASHYTLNDQYREDIAQTAEARKALVAEKATYAVAAGKAFQDLGAAQGGSHVNDPNSVSALITKLITVSPTEGKPYDELRERILTQLGIQTDNVDVNDLDLSGFGEGFADKDFSDLDLLGGGVGGQELLGSKTTVQPGVNIHDPQYANQFSQEAAANWREGRQQALAAQEYGDRIANVETREDLIKQREAEVAAYNQQFQELMRKSENKAMTHNIIEGLGSIVSGLIGLATDLNVSGYYKMGELQKPAEYFNEAAPALQDAAQRSIQELDAQINHYLQEGDKWEARETQRFAQMQAAKQQGVALDLQYMQMVGDMQAAANKADASAQQLLKQMGEDRKYAQNMYAQEMGEVVDWAKNSQGTLKDFQTSIVTPYTEAVNAMGATGRYQNVNDPSVASSLLSTQGLAEDSGRLLSLTDQIMQAEGIPYHEAFKKTLQYHTALAQSAPIGALNSFMLGSVSPQQHAEIMAFISMEQQLYGDNARSGLNPAHIQAAIERMHSAQQWRNQASAAIQQNAASSWYSGTSYQQQAPTKGGEPHPLGKQTAGATPPIPEEIVKRLSQPEVANSFIHPQNLPVIEYVNPKTKEVRRWRGVSGEAAERAGLSREGRQGRLPEIANTDKFLNGVNAITAKYGLEADDLLSVVGLETAYTFNPRVVNPSTGATGLIQFMPSTSAGILGAPGSKTREAIIKHIGISKEELDETTKNPQAIQSLVAALPINFQLSLVDDYFSEKSRATDLNRRRTTLESQGKKLTGGWLYTTVLMGNTNAVWAAGGKLHTENAGLVTKVAEHYKQDPAKFSLTAEALAGYFDANLKKPFVANTKGSN